MSWEYDSIKEHVRASSYLFIQTSEALCWHVGYRLTRLLWLLVFDSPLLSCLITRHDQPSLIFDL